MYEPKVKERAMKMDSARHQSNTTFLILSVAAFLLALLLR